MEGKKPYSSTLDGHCCLSSGPRGVALIPTFAVTTDADGVVVNLYDRGQRPKLKLRDGTAVEARHRDANIRPRGRRRIALNPAEDREAFGVKLRVPDGAAVLGKRKGAAYRR